MTELATKIVDAIFDQWTADNGLVKSKAIERVAEVIAASYPARLPPNDGVPMAPIVDTFKVDDLIYPYGVYPESIYTSYRDRILRDKETQFIEQILSGALMTNNVEPKPVTPKYLQLSAPPAGDRDLIGDGASGLIKPCACDICKSNRAFSERYRD